MSSSIKYDWSIPLFFSGYLTLASFVLDPFIFLSSFNPEISYPFIFIASLSLSWSLKKLSKSAFQSAYGQLIIVAGIFTISIICGTIIWLLNGAFFIDPLLYFNTFLILPILPASVYTLWLMYFYLTTRVKVSFESQERADFSFQKLLRIENNQNQLILESSIDRIIAFEANDNYVHTYLLNDDGQVDRTMHRISLKKITELLEQQNVQFHRVHKSYLINPHFILQLKGKSQAYRVELKHLQMEIPVSRSFDVKLIHNNSD